MNYISKYSSPLGKITMASDGKFLTGLWFDGQKNFASTLGAEYKISKLPVFVLASKWLGVYFKGKEPDFMPPVSFRGTEFQKNIWNLLTGIPYGATITYSSLAGRYLNGKGGANNYARAVASAVAKNPVSIIVPCHRVTGSGGRLAGYAGGICRKQVLLNLEKSGSIYESC